MQVKSWNVSTVLVGKEQGSVNSSSNTMGKRTWKCYFDIHSSGISMYHPQLTLYKSGMYTEKPWDLGASADGVLVYDNNAICKILEIKCPNSAAKLNVQEDCSLPEWQQWAQLEKIMYIIIKCRVISITSCHAYFNSVHISCKLQFNLYCLFYPHFYYCISLLTYIHEMFIRGLRKFVNTAHTKNTCIVVHTVWNTV